MQIRLKMEEGNCPTLNMNAMHNYLLSHSLINCVLPLTKTVNVLLCCNFLQTIYCPFLSLLFF